MRNFLKKILVFIIFISVGCTHKKDNSNPKKTEIIIIDNDDLKNKLFLLNTEYQKLLSNNWFKKDSSIVNDEYDKWLESKFYFSYNEWLKISYSDIDGRHPNYLESNSNEILNNKAFNLGDRLDKIILLDKIKFDFDEYGIFLLKYDECELFLDCSSKIDDMLFERLQNVKESNSIENFPQELKDCKIIAFREYKKLDNEGSE